MIQKFTPLRIGALILAAAGLMIGPSAARPQAGDAEKEAAIKAALDYSDGAYSGDAVRMERAIHPDLNKVYFYRRSPATGLASIYSTASSLIERTRAASFNLEPEKRLTETAVLEIKDDVACVRVKTAQFCDFLQMIKVNGQWKIINVLWTLGLNTPPAKKVVPDFDAEKERPAAQMDEMAFAVAQMSTGTAYLQLQLMDGQWKAINILIRPTNNLTPQPPPAKK